MNLCNLVDQYIEVRNKLVLVGKHIKDKKPVDMKFYFNLQKLADEFDSLWLQIRYESIKEDPLIVSREFIRISKKRDCCICDMK